MGAGKRAAKSTSTGLALVVALVLFSATFALFARARDFEFLNYDDDLYVLENPAVRAGLTAAGLSWAFGSGHAANWHPLTWVSHMLDVELHGLDPGGHHLTSVFLHALAAALAFAALRSLTGSLWRSTLAAAFFAWHPLRVESVAWVAERKDVLAGVFGLAALWAYAGHARRPAAARLACTSALLALGLLAKPTLVTLPCVFLLLDAWPLGRAGWLRLGGDSPSAAPSPDPSPAPTHPELTAGAHGGHRIWLEKSPLFALALASALVTLRVQRAGGAIGPLEALPFGARAANALESWAAYLVKSLWPSGLCAFYPHPGIGEPDFAPWSTRAIASGAALALLSLLAWRARRRAPAVLIGWLWFLGALVPAIGLVQVGIQARADRYTYLPSLGLGLALFWGLPALVPERSLQRRVLLPLALLGLALLAGATWRQLGTWRDSASVFERALRVTERNFVAHVNLGQALEAQGRLEQAGEQFRAALALRPELAPARVNLARVLRRQGRADAAQAELRRALDSAPDLAEAQAELGWLLAEAGRDGEALAHLRAAVALAPGESAFGNNLAWVLATSRSAAQPGEALAIAERLCAQGGERQAGFLETRAAALARLGRFEEASRWQARAVELVPPRARAELERRLALYRDARPFLKEP